MQRIIVPSCKDTESLDHAVARDSANTTSIIQEESISTNKSVWPFRHRSANIRITVRFCSGRDKNQLLGLDFPDTVFIVLYS